MANLMPGMSYLVLYLNHRCVLVPLDGGSRRRKAGLVVFLPRAGPYKAQQTVSLACRKDSR